MEENRYHGLIVSYFISRHDTEAYAALGYGTQLATHKALGEIFGVKYTTIQNWRDEFDSVHDTPRQGWYQRPLAPSRKRVVEQLSSLSFDALSALVQKLILGPSADVEIEIPSSVLMQDDETAQPSDGSTEAWSRRAATGKLAEEAFEQFFKTYHLPCDGELVDGRQLGQGYDYEIRCLPHSVYVEVKGLAEDSGSLTLTGNEWIAARHLKDRFYIALVLNVASVPRVILFRNPGERIMPKLRIVPVVQEQWSIASSMILEAAPQ